jgi:hypothetical protein
MVDDEETIPGTQLLPMNDGNGGNITFSVDDTFSFSPHEEAQSPSFLLFDMPSLPTAFLVGTRYLIIQFVINIFEHSFVADHLNGIPFWIFLFLEWLVLHVI